MHLLNTDIGAFIKANVQALAPASQVAGSRNGTAIDITDFRSGVLVVNLGAVSGTPTTTSVTYALQSNTDGGSTGWAALKDQDGNGITLAVTAGGASQEKDFTLQYIPQDHLFVRVTETVAFTGGTAPAVLSSATFVLGGAQRLPI